MFAVAVRAWCAVLAVLVPALLAPAPAPAQGNGDRVALVIGNAAYRNERALANPVNDAADMAALLSRLGFQVVKIENANGEDMRRALRDFNRAAAGAHTAVVFFAGHGIEVGGENYLVPVDAEMRSDGDAEHEAIGLRQVLIAVSRASRLGLVILDACRNDPFRSRMQTVASLTRTVTRGLARVEPRSSTMVAFAAREGSVAIDGAAGARNSPFTAALLRNLERSEDVRLVMGAVRDDVMRQTQQQQEPAIYASLGGERVQLVALPPRTDVPPGPFAGNDDFVWNLVRDTRDIEVLRGFLQQFPQSRHRQAAEARIAALTSATLRAPDHECDRLAAHPDDAQRVPSVPGVLSERVDGSRALQACQAALAAYPHEVRFIFQLGRALQSLARHEDAIFAYRRAADLGSAQAISNLGLMYENGRGVARDDAEAVRLYRRAADLGNAFAMHRLGIVLRDGRGVARNRAEAIAWLQRAVDAGRREARVDLESLRAASPPAYTRDSTFEQPASVNPPRERSVVTVIRCANSRQQYYVYRYFRPSGPNYRVIMPPRWGNPVGGGDHLTFDDAVQAACS